jgi:hypothetical protein
MEAKYALALGTFGALLRHCELIRERLVYTENLKT